MGKIALVGTFPPRRCGIATFTNDLNNGLKQAGCDTIVVAINDGLKEYKYPPCVRFEIDQNDLSSYVKASNFLNTNDVDAVILQHEFGIFGGRHGRHILQLLKRLRMPVITTLHTILDEPVPDQKHLLTEICHLSERVVSISQKGIELLEDSYGIAPEKMVHIHHGVPVIKVGDQATLKEKLGAKGRKILLTFGLLSKNKSIEVVIKALPAVIEKYPDLLYIVLGATHPHVVKHEGEAYRHSLIRLVNKLGLDKNVVFIDRFVTTEELFKYLKACDIYVIPYSTEKQISSGTLIYTMSAGKPIISTPFWYAQEMLAQNRGLLFDFNDHEQLSHRIIDLLSDEKKRKSIGQNAFKLTKHCYWPAIGKQYKTLVSHICKENIKRPADYQIGEDEETAFFVPPLNINHLRVLTDDTGILQHARYNIPDRTHGYCIDDNARALILSVMLQNEVQDTDELIRLTSVYLSFVDFALNPANGRFRNFMSYDRQWLEEAGSEDSFGRTVWALGYTVANTEIDNFYYHAKYLLDQGLAQVQEIKQMRAMAYLVLGLGYYLQKEGDENIKNLLSEKATKLSSFFDKTVEQSDWLWCEPIVTYANNRIPQALLSAGLVLHNKDFVQRGLRLLDWLIGKQFSNGVFSPIGNTYWLTPKRKSHFDQQPLEAYGMIDACLLAEEVAKDGRYADLALKAFSWFTGENDCSSPLYDFATGGCRDGLISEGVNLNQGAESTLSWLLSLMQISYYLRKKK